MQDTSSNQRLFDTPGATSPLDTWLSTIKRALPSAAAAVDQRDAMIKANQDRINEMNRNKPIELPKEPEQPPATPAAPPSISNVKSTMTDTFKLPQAIKKIKKRLRL
jgi:hypothetical protein